MSMLFIRWTRVREHEVGLVFRAGVFRRLLDPGRHLVVDPLLETRIQKVSVREPWLDHPDLEVIVRSGALAGRARVLDLGDHERALVWIDGRLRGGPRLGPARPVDGVPRGARRGDRHADGALRAPGAAGDPAGDGRRGRTCETAVVAPGWVGLLFQDGRLRGDAASRACTRSGAARATCG